MTAPAAGATPLKKRPRDSAAEAEAGVAKKAKTAVAGGDGGGGGAADDGDILTID